MPDVHYREAERLMQPGVRRSLRTPDAFVRADQGLCGVAYEEGLHIIAPELF
jgi:hypothetical protein